MKVLIACEFSGIVREAFRKRGHDAWSCDLLPSEIEGNHIICDAYDLIHQGWDLMIAHPPCTYLCIANAIHYNREKWGNKKVDAKLKNQAKAIRFFEVLREAEIPKIAIENPLPLKILTNVVGKYNQIVHPYFFGESFSKKTCLWLKGLPELTPTNMVDQGKMIPNKKGGTNPAWSHLIPYGPNRQKIRSRTFQGIADAMAEQWG